MMFRAMLGMSKGTILFSDNNANKLIVEFKNTNQQYKIIKIAPSSSAVNHNESRITAIYGSP